MKNMHKFLICFYVLDKCYPACQEDIFCSMLGALDPELLQDGYPMDKAYYDDLMECVALDDPLTLESVIRSLYAFLEFESEKGFELEEAKKQLLTLRNRPELLNEALDFSARMYEKHNYPD